MSDSRKSGSAPVRGLAFLQQQYIKSSPRVPIPSSPSNSQIPNLAGSHSQSPFVSRPRERTSSQSSLLPPSQKPSTPDSDNVLSFNENEKQVPRSYQLYDFHELMRNFTPGQPFPTPNIPQSLSVDTSRCSNYSQLKDTFYMVC